MNHIRASEKGVTRKYLYFIIPAGLCEDWLTDQDTRKVEQQDPAKGVKVTKQGPLCAHR